MNRLLKRHSKAEKGFTLVELLIVFTLLAVMAAIMIPNVAGFVQFGRSQANKAETSVIQTAMDAMMAKENIPLLTAGNGITDWSTHPVEKALYPDYLRFKNSQSSYDYNTSGLVSYNATNWNQ